MMRNRNKLASLLLGLVFAISTVAMGCGGGGSSEMEDACSDVCEAIDECEPQPGATSLCIKSCVDEFDDADEFDGEACVDARFAAFSCAEKLVCDDLFTLLAFEVREELLGRLLVGELLCEEKTLGNPVVILGDCCEFELAAMVGNCPETFDLKLKK